MRKDKTIYDKLALKEKMLMMQKARGMKTLQEELTRVTSIKDQLKAIVDDTAIKKGETSVRELRSSNWYSAQIHDQLATVENRSEFLSEEVGTQKKYIAEALHRHNRSLEKADERRRLLREEREEKAASDVPRINRASADR